MKWVKYIPEQFNIAMLHCFALWNMSQVNDILNRDEKNVTI